MSVDQAELQGFMSQFVDEPRRSCLPCSGTSFWADESSDSTSAFAQNGTAGGRPTWHQQDRDNGTLHPRMARGAGGGGVCRV